ncbi:DUF6985 domain-containing protein [Hymenobacter lapidiphilus]|uniref:DUF6985 domain-containing protein n=1 Tax=Hymenobacter lapidiphilus TaxID=2608003 RepID=A0A7Y7PQU7_9BACT|nr:hypothetical protein [Hymenobacter lapidiphilus]NVO32376.1 hypothetical protein [Hymenobacter lapidiphilus]
MNNWKEYLRFDQFEGLEARVPLSFLQTESPVRLSFGEYAEGEELPPESVAAVDAVLKRLPALEKLVADAAFEHYKMICREFGRIYGEEFVSPKAENELDLQRLYQLRAVYFPEEPEIGRFGLGFTCDWEEEHGFGLQFRSWQIVEVGGDAEAFSFYD